MVKKKISIEFILAIIIAILISASLLSQQYSIVIPENTIIILLSIFIFLKIFHIIRKRGTVFEDYATLFIIIIFGILYFFVLESKINTLILIFMVLTILYSAGITRYIQHLSRSRNIISFIISYFLVVVAVIVLFSGVYATNNTLFIANGEPTRLTFEDSLYFSIITFTTVGYGDIAPLGLNRMIASAQAISALLLNIAFIGYVLSSRRFTKFKTKHHHHPPHPA